MKRVGGVHAVANDIEVRLPAIDQRPDPDIARDAVAALKSELPISHDKIKIIVKNGWITLEGAAEWQYQKTAAETAMRKVKGVKGVTNVITVKPKVEPTDIQRKIQEAFKRNAEVDANRITVEAKKIGKKAQKAAMKASEKIQDTAYDAADATGDAIKSGTQKAKNITKENAKKVHDATKRTVIKASEKVQDTAYDAADATEDAIKSAGDATKENAKKATNFTFRKIKSGAEKVIESTEE